MISTAQFLLLCITTALALPLGLRAATPTTPSPAASGPVVALPPMIVAEPFKAQPWLYVAAGDTEFLSRCSKSITRDFVTTQLEIHRALRGFVPPEFLATSVPLIVLVLPMSSMPGPDDAVLRNLRQGRLAESANVHFLPNQRLEDHDMTAVFNFLDESNFSGERLIVAEDFFEALLLRRTPMLPAWLIEGLVRIYDHAYKHAVPMVLPPLIWLSFDESMGLQRDPEGRRPLLPGNELFAPDAVIGPDHTHAVRRQVWSAQCALFVRWALDPAQPGARTALWRLAERVSREPMTETIFAESFGFGYSDLRDRLSDYLPTAVKASVKLAPAELPPLPRFEIKTATVAQVARLRGEWERLEIPFVRQHHPEFLPRYIAQARLTLRRATSRGERDPQLLATVALCELDAGDPAAALPLLEAAGAANVVRPRVYFETARLRWEALTRNAPPEKIFTVAELQPVLAPLQTARTQFPPLPEVFLLTFDAWLRCEQRIPAAELEKLVAAVPLFRRYAGFGLRVALLQLKNGRRAEAAAVLSSGLEFLADPTTRARRRKLLAALAAPPLVP
ncbi:MAG: hypothetical protein H7343_22780 [Undibacterium sp.]|nr:hypothetical protein [Opitutaceae bacterium]